MSTEDGQSSGRVVGTAPKSTTRSPSWRIIYSNISGIHFGDNDCKIVFGFDMDISKPGEEILEEAVVVMTPRTVKMLAYSLTAVIQNFESVHGTIQVPRLDEMQANLEKAGLKKPTGF
jgi:hypothetical protein